LKVDAHVCRADAPTHCLNAVKLTRHSGRDCRNPEHREVTSLCHPWLLDPGIPCRGDVIRLNLTALPTVSRGLLFSASLFSFRLIGAPYILGDGGQPLVSGPKSGAGQRCRREQAGIDVTDASPHQAMPIDEEQHFLMGRWFAFRQSGQQREDFLAVFEIAAGDFPNDEVVDRRYIAFEKPGEMGVAGSQMIDPD
jgi:hypothetical protein